MLRLLFALACLLLALAGMVVRKTYYQLPIHELKRRARHDATAKQLYRAVAYGDSTRALLWAFIGLTSAASVILFARLLPVWASLLVVGPLLWLVFSLLPSTRVTAVGERLAVYATPVIAGSLNYLHPILSRVANFAQKYYVMARHTRLFEKDDLLDLIARQRGQADSRFTNEELEIAERALRFGEHQVSDVLVPRSDTKSLLQDDTVGPVLIDEVHKSGQAYILVRESKKGPFVGILESSQLGLQSSGQVRDLMRPTVYYLHVDDSLSEALHAFFITNYPVFVVVNSFEEFVGTVAVEDVLKQLLGHIPGNDFDQYADVSAVARRHKSAPEAENAIDAEE